MAALSSPIIDTLVGLVEAELRYMSSDGRDRSEAYRDLQNCLYALRIMAARASRENAMASDRQGQRERPSYLRAIAGGKA